MRVMFLCSSLEPGRDGVGDYTRLLARQCRVLGLECAVVALHDHHIQESREVKDAGEVSELRLPAAMPWPERVKRTVAARESFRPDWMSLQFVPYGFNTKGIVWNLRPHLQEMVHDVRLHLMLHELWIGASRSASWKERAVGMLQRAAILRLIEALGPDSVATSNSTYVAMLEKRGFSARKLALFGNIPVTEDKDRMAPVGGWPVSFDGEQHDRSWLGVFFGTLHPEWEPEPLFSTIHRAARTAGRQVRFVSVGRLGAMGEKKWALMAERYAGAFSFAALGEQAPESVSKLLQQADFGIAASPWQLIGKSGSAAAMLEHGLPVIANRDDWKARDIEGHEAASDPLLHRCDALLEEKMIAGLAKRAPGNGVRDVAEQFIQNLRFKMEGHRTACAAAA